ncbi:MAG: UDP-N-acetylmuramoyl-tripeptide--D-alanyl-D-alanine ligase [Bacteroidales bacterium]
MDITISKLLEKISSGAGISTDSRNIQKNDIFFALKGENFDGNRFAFQCLEKGAIAAVVDDETIEADENIIQVADVLETLQQLAIEYRKRLTIPVIGITGSNGKTTTKELMALILSEKYNTFFTRGNLNNHIGVPLSILSIKPGHEIAIIEMGANHVGEIKMLSEIAQPSHGLITNIGKAHIEGFGSVENILIGKTELYRYLQSTGGLIFINPSHTKLKGKLGNYPNFFTYGTNSDVGCRGELQESKPFLKLSIAHQHATKEELQTIVSTHLVGSYNLENVLAAAAVGIKMGVSLDQIKQGIEKYNPENNRSQLKQTQKNQIIMDAYNANPTSMALALNSFTDMDAPHKTLILGDMLEMGSEAEKEHQQIIDLTLQQKYDLVILVGEEFGKVKPHATNYFAFSDVEKAAEWLKNNPVENKTILMKGSRGIQLEKTAQYL